MTQFIGLNACMFHALAYNVFVANISFFRV